MRMMLGLDRPDAGSVRIGGKSYHDLRSPLREVGALLEAKAFHPGRTARAHLSALAVSSPVIAPPPVPCERARVRQPARIEASREPVPWR